MALFKLSKVILREMDGKVFLYISNIDMSKYSMVIILISVTIALA